MWTHSRASCSAGTVLLRAPTRQAARPSGSSIPSAVSRPSPILARINEPQDSSIDTSIGAEASHTIDAWHLSPRCFALQSRRLLWSSEVTKEVHRMAKRRKVIVHIGTSADGYIARPDGDLEWLTSRPKPAGFYGMADFVKTIDTKLLGRT